MRDTCPVGEVIGPVCAANSVCSLSRLRGRAGEGVTCSASLRPNSGKPEKPEREGEGMAERLQPDICVIGAGSGGLSVAAAAAAFGVSVVLIERAKMGGECL